MSETLLTLHDVSLGYDRRVVLEHLSFAVERGECLALVGPNGAGKTTLLRGILGLIPVLAGQIAYGFDRALSPPGYVPQRDTLDPIFPLSVFDVVLIWVHTGAWPCCAPRADASASGPRTGSSRSVWRTWLASRFGRYQGGRSNGY